MNDDDFVKINSFTSPIRLDEIDSGRSTPDFFSQKSVESSSLMEFDWNRDEDKFEFVSRNRGTMNEGGDVQKKLEDALDLLSHERESVAILKHRLATFQQNYETLEKDYSSLYESFVEMRQSLLAHERKLAAFTNARLPHSEFPLLSTVHREKEVKKRIAAFKKTKVAKNRRLCTKQ